MTKELHLLLVVPYGIVTATSLGIEGYALHRSPGSGKHFSGRTVLVDLAVKADDQPDFRFLDEGNWRDAQGDSVAALRAVRGGKRTKTGVSNNGFSCTPVEAYRGCYLVKTGGKMLQMEPSQEMISFSNHDCDEGMSPEQIARVIGRPFIGRRIPRLYMVLCPIQLVMLSNLTPEEYAWYATHRPGKIFRQVMFTELLSEQPNLAAQSRFENARRELLEKPDKKTKTIAFEDCINHVAFGEWLGYRRETSGGIYAADRNGVSLWQFPADIPVAWDRLDG
jgi:hypothetical protein